MYDSLSQIESDVKNCTKCDLCNIRINTVFATGNKKSKVMFIGESPSEDEDKLGEAFSGKSSSLLKDVLLAQGFDFDKMYYTNIIKCRHLDNKTISKEEVNGCIEYLRYQVKLINPQIVLLMGNVSLKAILGDNMQVTTARGKIVEKKGIKYIPTYHPAALMRDENKKIEFWEDIETLKDECVLNCIDVFK